MEKFMQGVNRFIRDEEGVTAIEYGLLAALIAVAIIATVQGVGEALNTTFTTVGTELDAANAMAPTAP